MLWLKNKLNKCNYMFILLLFYYWLLVSASNNNNNNNNNKHIAGSDGVHI